METQYFATLPADDLAAELCQRTDSYYNWLLTSGRLVRWRTAYNTYYGNRGTHKSYGLSAGGDKGELTFLMSNEYRNLVQHLMVMATQSRPALDYIAENNDSESKAATYLARGIVEYFRRNAGIDDNNYLAAEMSLIFDTAWVINEWDPMKGDAIRPDAKGHMINNGDVYSRARTPLDVIIDYTRTDTDRDWIIVRDQVNKWDVAAQYTEKAEDLKAIKRSTYSDQMFRFGEVTEFEDSKSPLIDRFTFYHRKTAACPTGRLLQFYSPKCWTFSGPIPYRKLPGNRICPTEMILSSLGYSNANDLLSLQDAMDALISAGITNMTTLGTNNVWVESAEDFDFEQLAQGMNLIEGGKKPEILQLNHLPPEWLAITNFIAGRMETISGVNSVARGNLDGKDLSGSAMALLQSMAIQFNNGFQRSITKAIEDSGNDVIMLTQDFADVARLGIIVGRSNRFMMKSYKGSDIKQVKRVYALSSNPMKDTVAGRMTIAQDYIKMGVVKNPADYDEVMQTGTLASITDPERNLRLSIDMENDALQRGEKVAVLKSDNHLEHLAKHRTLFASPEDRADARLLDIVGQHEADHMKMWRTTPPELLAAYGIPPFPVMQPPALPPGAGAPPTGSPEGAGPESVVSDAPPAGPPGPEMPENPLSGEQFNPQNGGLGA